MCSFQNWSKLIREFMWSASNLTQIAQVSAVLRACIQFVPDRPGSLPMDMGAPCQTVDKKFEMFKSIIRTAFNYTVDASSTEWLGLRFYFTVILFSIAVTRCQGSQSLQFPVIAMSKARWDHGFLLDPAVTGKDWSPRSAHPLGHRVLFNVMAEGAKGDGKTDDTEVICFLHIEPI